MRDTAASARSRRGSPHDRRQAAAPHAPHVRRKNTSAGRRIPSPSVLKKYGPSIVFPFFIFLLSFFGYEPRACVFVRAHINSPAAVFQYFPHHPLAGGTTNGKPRNERRSPRNERQVTLRRCLTLRGVSKSGRRNAFSFCRDVPRRKKCLPKITKHDKMLLRPKTIKEPETCIKLPTISFM